MLGIELSLAVVSKYSVLSYTPSYKVFGFYIFNFSCGTKAQSHPFLRVRQVLSWSYFQACFGIYPLSCSESGCVQKQLTRAYFLALILVIGYGSRRLRS